MFDKAFIPRSMRFSQIFLLKFLKAGFHVVMAATLFMGVIALNGRPVVFADSNIYNWMGEMQFRPLRYALSPLIGGPSSEANDPSTKDEALSEMRLRHTEMAARSPWFGMFLYATTKVGNLWTFAWGQALMASLVLYKVFRRLCPHCGMRSWYLLILGLCCCTTLPFFIGFVMPDLWSGLGIIALCALLFPKPDKTSEQKKARSSDVVLFAAVLISVLCHPSHGPVVVSAGLGIFVISWLYGALCRKVNIAKAGNSLATKGDWLCSKGLQFKIPHFKGLVLAVCAFAIALSLQFVYAKAIEAATGDVIQAPPFLIARLLADGPGRVYLRHSCDEGANWALCRFRHSRLKDSQEILWSGNSKRCVFGCATARERQKIAREQAGFVKGVILSDPLGVLSVFAEDSWKALGNIRLEDPLRDPHFYLTDPDWRDTYIADFLRQIADCGPHANLCRPWFSENLLFYWHSFCFDLSLLGLIGWIVYRRNVETENNGLFLSCLIFFSLALLSNAMITGIISGPFARYQSRLTWIIPFLFLMRLLSWWEDRRGLYFNGSGANGVAVQGGSERSASRA